MLTKEQAKADAWLAIADLVGKDYFRSHFEGACQAYPCPKDDNVEYEYFLAFEGDSKSNLCKTYKFCMIGYR